MVSCFCSAGASAERSLLRQKTFPVNVAAALRGPFPKPFRVTTAFQKIAIFQPSLDYSLETLHVCVCVISFLPSLLQYVVGSFLVTSIEDSKCLLCFEYLVLSLDLGTSLL